MNNEIPCMVCGELTPVRFNIDLKATPICESCAAAIFMQQAQWYTQAMGDMVPRKDYEEVIIQIGELQEEIKNLRHTLRDIM